MSIQNLSTQILVITEVHKRIAILSALAFMALS